MGQKVNPIGLRLGINRNWESRWFPNFKTAPAALGEDHKIRTFLKKELYYAGVANIIIERTVKRLRVTIVAARPGIIIGKKGADIEKLKTAVQKNTICVLPTGLGKTIIASSIADTLSCAFSKFVIDTPAIHSEICCCFALYLSL